jgi:RimJ/RimL family protein N-acetyltransferase
VPLSPDHVGALAAAASQDRSTYAWTSVPTADSMPTYVHALLSEAVAGAAVPFVQVRAKDDAVVGATRFLHLRDHAVEIGGTWLSGSAQRTGINREAKLLLLGYAFEELGLEAGRPVHGRPQRTLSDGDLGTRRHLRRGAAQLAGLARPRRGRALP